MVHLWVVAVQAKYQHRDAAASNETRRSLAPAGELRSSVAVAACTSSLLLSCNRARMWQTQPLAPTAAASAALWDARWPKAYAACSCTRARSLLQKRCASASTPPADAMASAQPDSFASWCSA